MNSDNNFSENNDASKVKISRVAGFMFLFSFIVPAFNWVLVLSSFISNGDVSATTNNIYNNQSLFRIGLSIELIMSIGLVVLACALYTILKNVNRNLSLTALLLKMIEAAITTVIVLITFIALLHGGDVVGFLINKHTVLYSIPMLFLGLDMTIFSYLFLKSGYIPGWIAKFGMISFMLIFIHSIMFIVTPQYAEMSINQIIFWTPSGIFELIIGSWLLLKGIKVK